MNQFEKMGIDEDFNPYYKEEGIQKPTEVQRKVIPNIINGKSTICIAQTGTGKTLAYALPTSELVKRIEDEEGLTRKRSKPYVVIIAPTKELGVQIQQVYKDISHHVKLRTRTLIGAPRGSSTGSLKNQSYEILVSTPTRLARSLKSGEVSFEQIKYLIFDEADNLFELGFKKEIDRIINHVKFDETDIHFFSATMSEDIEDYLQEKFAKKNLISLLLNTAHKVQQRIETFNIYVSPKEKKEMLKLFLQKTAKGRGIVFANQKNQIVEIEAFIKEALPKLKYKVLHGDLPQKERLANHKAFVNKKAQVLFATDVAARGIDIKDVEWVVNFGLPKTAIYYLHRCGRTGRGGRSGQVFNMVTSYDSKLIGFINEAIKKQSSLDIDVIAKDMSEVKRKSSKPKKNKVKTKRVKITKRNRNKY